MTTIGLPRSLPPPHFAASRARLFDAVLDLARAVSETLRRAVQAFGAGDEAAARLVLEAARAGDVEGRRLDEDALKVLALYRPDGRDLRRLVWTQKLVRDLVRVGDLATRVAEQTRGPAGARSQEASALARAADLVREMLLGAAGALLALDLAAARRVLDAAPAAEAVRAAIVSATATRMGSDSAAVRRDLVVEAGTSTLTVLDVLERVARRAVHVAEGVFHLLEETVLRRVC